MKLKKDRKPSSQRGYDARWRKVRDMKLRYNPLCEECDKGGLVVTATMVHHIISIEDGGDPLLWDNLMSLCLRCHGIKHGISDMKIIGGCDNSGKPIHPEHPWNKK